MKFKRYGEKNGEDKNDEGSGGFAHDVIDLTEDFCEAGRGELENRSERMSGEVKTDSRANGNKQPCNFS